MQPACSFSGLTVCKGEKPGKEEIMNLELFIPIVGSVMVFTFLSISVWVNGQRKEREAYYRAETFRRMAEASGEGAKAAVELLREEERIKAGKTREGLKIGGLVNLAVGVGLMIFLRALIGDEPVYLVGLIPGLIGVALLVYALFLAPPVE
jgi:hypothetical protein